VNDILDAKLQRTKCFMECHFRRPCDQGHVTKGNVKYYTEKRIKLLIILMSISV